MEEEAMDYVMIGSFVNAMDKDLPIELNLQNAYLERWLYNLNEVTYKALVEAIRACYCYMQMKE